MQVQSAIKSRSIDHSTDNNNHYFQATEREIIRMVQKRRFHGEIDAMNMEKSSVKLKKCSTIYNLDPFMGADGLIRVGGRLKHSHLNNSCKHPVLLPKQEKVTDLVLKWCHAKCAHGGRGATLNELRRLGYWVVNGNSAVPSKLFKVKRKTWYSKNGQSMIKQINGSTTIHLLWG